MAPPGPDSDAVKELAAKHGGALTGLTGDRVATHDSEDAAGVRLDFSRPWRSQTVDGASWWV